MGMDPFTNVRNFNKTSNLKFFKSYHGRIRDKNGNYQSIDLSQSGKD